MMGTESPAGRGDLRKILWTARIAAALIVLFSVMMLVGYGINPQGNPPTSTEKLLLALFPIGMCLGYVIGWFRPLIGGVLSWAAIVAFVLIQRNAGMVIILGLLGIPGILFIVYGLRIRRLPVGETPD